MAEEEIKLTETAPTTPVDETPKKELDNTTGELIKEALSGATDKSKPWYKRGLSYIIAVALIAAFYAGGEVGPDVINAIVQVIQSVLG